jgi:plasmid stability protein
MATLTIKNIPESLVKRLKQRAAQHRRSLNSEVIDMLDSTTRVTPTDVEEEIARIRARRPIPETIRITQKQLNAWKREGRA